VTIKESIFKEEVMTAKISIFILSMLFLGTAHAVKAHATSPSEVEGFVETAPYATDSKEFSCANMSREEWAVGFKKNKPVITPAQRRTEITLNIGGGQFIGKDGGEFAGDLRFNKGKESQPI
jgi:hypothetical protein